MADAEHRRHLALERRDLGSHDESLAVADALDGGENFRTERLVLRMQVEERHIRRHRSAMLSPRFHRGTGSAAGLAPPDRLALVVFLLALPTRYGHRDAAVLGTEPRRHARRAAFGGL